jgi:tetratricopeptide (TPR) repeat protein
LVLLAFATSSFAATPEALYASGRQAMRAGDASKAIEFFEQAVKAKPRTAEYHYWLGSAYGNAAAGANILKQASLARKALAALEKTVELDANHLEARLALIQFYKMAPGIMGGSDEKALKEAAEIKKRDAVMGHAAYARIHRFDKKPELATKEYLDAIRAQPASGKARDNYANHLIGLKNYKQAFEELETAAKFNPPYMPALFRIGALAVISESNYARGEETLKKYLTSTPADDEPQLGRAWYWLGQIYEKQGRKADAKASFANSLRLQPGAKDVTTAMKRVS